MKELGTYIGLRVDPLSVKKIENIYSKHFDNLIYDMHLTLMYAKEQDVLHTYPANPYKHYLCKVTGIDIFGDPGSEYQALVLKVSCPHLTRRHAAIKKVFGLKHSYPEFKPHISIKYKPTEQEQKYFLNLKNEIVGTQIEVSSEYVEPIRE